MRLRHITRRTRSLIVAGWLLFMRGISKIAGYDSGGTGNRVAAMMMMWWLLFAANKARFWAKHRHKMFETNAFFAYSQIQHEVDSECGGCAGSQVLHKPRAGMCTCWLSACVEVHSGQRGGVQHQLRPKGHRANEHDGGEDKWGLAWNSADEIDVGDHNIHTVNNITRLQLAILIPVVGTSDCPLQFHAGFYIFQTEFRGIITIMESRNHEQ